MEKPSDVHAARRRSRIGSASLGLLGVAGIEWFVSQINDYPAWFLALLPGLVAVNLLNWVLEPAPHPEMVACKHCGRIRAAQSLTACPHCGNEGFHIPWLNWLALGLIVAFFLAASGSFLWEVADSRVKEATLPRYAAATIMFVMAILVVGDMIGFTLSRRLNHALGRFFPYRFERDVGRLRWQRHLAIRVILLIGSLAVFVAAVSFLLRQ